MPHRGTSLWYDKLGMWLRMSFRLELHFFTRIYTCNPLLLNLALAEIYDEFQ